MRYVVIGNSAAAVGCVEGIRSMDGEGEIVLLSREKQHTYSRPLISYLLCGKTNRQRMRYRPDDFYEHNRCDFRPGVSALSIDPQRKTVLTDTGDTLPYDRLLVATGSRPFVPPMDGLDHVEQKTAFMSLDDAEYLEHSLTPDSRVLIIGAGLIGLKCAEGIAGRCASITVVDLADRILPSILEADAAELVQAHIEKHGVSFVLNDSVKRFRPGQATLVSGRTIEFDLLVLAVGVRPNTDLIAQAGGKVNRGIAADLFCRTSLPDIYAAGDCAESLDITTGQEKVLALLPNAYMQGHAAGINMAGGTERYDYAIPMNAIGFFGLHMLTAGSYAGERYEERKPDGYRLLVTADNRLKGFILVGDVARAGIYTSLIRRQTPLDTLDFDRVREKPQLLAFSREQRQQMLGGNPV